MAYTWGSTTLNVVPESYQPFHCENGLTEITILPLGTTNPASVLQQAGRTRKKVAFNGFTMTYAAYASLLADYIALTQRTWNDGNTSMTMIISELSEATQIIDGKWEYSIVLTEV